MTHLKARPLIAIIALSIVAFFPLLGTVPLFDWDEINFAEIAREMIVTKNYAQVQIDFQPFYEKPPLFFWLQVLSMKLWGINEFAARFPNALFGILTLVTLYWIGSKYQANKKLGILWVLMHSSALLPHFYFKTGIIDPVFNYFIFLGIYSLTRLVGVSTAKKSNDWALFGGIAIGLAILTKGPVALLIPGITCVVYWLINSCKPLLAWSGLCIFCLTALLIPMFWMGYETYQHGMAFIQAFFHYQVELFMQPVAGHAQPFYYHFLVVLVGCFPASILALGSLFQGKSSDESVFFSFMQILFWVVMLLFSLVTTKIMHYSSIAYFPITFLAAHYLYHIEQKRSKPSRIMLLTFLLVGIVVSILLSVISMIGIFKGYIARSLADNFASAILAMPVAWSLIDCLVGISYLILVIVAYMLFKKMAIMHFAKLCSLATILCLHLGTLLIVPKVEAHIQGPAIQFYQQLQGQEAYVATIGFKSYALLFYFQQPNDQQFKRSNSHWLLTGRIDKPAYFVVKITDKALLDQLPDIKLLKIAGGFAFYKRAKVL